MNYQSVLNILEKKIGRESIAFLDLKEIISSGSTGGEISSMVGKYLKDLEKSNNELFKFLEKFISNYLKECRNQGLFVI